MSRRLVYVLSVGGVLSACAVRRPLTAPAEPLAGGPPGQTRGDQECQAVVDSVVAHQLVAPPARMHELVLPPPAPAAARGQTAVITFHVDRHGAVLADSTEIRGVTDPAYLGRVRAMAAKSTFWPTVINGCAVPATAELRLEAKP